MLTAFDDEVAQHAANSVPRAPRGIRTTRKVCRRQRIEIPQCGAADGRVVRQTVCDVKPWQGGHLLHCIAEPIGLCGESQPLVPGLALPYGTGALGEGLNLAILVARHMPYEKVNVIGVRMGLKASLYGAEAGEGFAQSVP